MVAILIFGLGAGISFYEGVQKLLNRLNQFSFTANRRSLSQLALNGCSVIWDGFEPRNSKPLQLRKVFGR